MQSVVPVEVRNVTQTAAEDTIWNLKAVGADTSPFSGDGIVVAVLDTGIDTAHPAFSEWSYFPGLHRRGKW